MGEIARWSTTASNNTFASPYGAQGSYAVSTVDNWERQNMSSIKEAYEDIEWLDYSDAYVSTLTYVSASSFTIAADVTLLFTPYRKVKIYGSSFGTHTGIVLTSTFSSPNTTITVRMDDGAVLTSNISYSNGGYIVLSSSGVKAPGVTHDPSGATYPYLFGGQALSTWISSPKNIIIGGNFTNNPWQRGISFVGVADNTYTADRVRWTQSSECVVNIEKVADAPTVAACGYYTTSCLRVSVTTADSSIGAAQFAAISLPIEGYDANQVNHQFYTISFYVKAVKAGIYCAALRNSGLDRSYVFDFTVNTANVWQLVQLPLNALSSASAGTWDSTTGIGLELVITLAAGTNYRTTAGAWQTGNFIASANQVNGVDSISNTFSIALVGIVKGFTTFDWSDENISQLFEKCQRYAYKTYDLGVIPLTATLTGAVYGIATGSAAAYLNFHLPVAMRLSASITGTLYSTSTGTAGKFRNQTTAADVDAVIQVRGTKNVVASTSGSPAVGNVISGQALFTSELT